MPNPACPHCHIEVNIFKNRGQVIDDVDLDEVVEAEITCKNCDGKFFVNLDTLETRVVTKE